MKPAVTFPMKPSRAANDNLIDWTCKVWQPRLGRDLTGENARQIIKNVTSFFDILAEWYRAEVPAAANDAAKPSTSDAGETRHES